MTVWGGDSGSSRKSTRFRSSTEFWGFGGVDSLSVEVGRRSPVLSGFRQVTELEPRLANFTHWSVEFGISMFTNHFEILIFLYESRSTLSEPRQRSARYAEKRVTAYRSRDAAIYAAARVAAYMNIRVFMCSRVYYVRFAATCKDAHTRPSKKAAISRGSACRRVS